MLPPLGSRVQPAYTCSINCRDSRPGARAFRKGSDLGRTSPGGPSGSGPASGRPFDPVFPPGDPRGSRTAVRRIGRVSLDRRWGKRDPASESRRRPDHVPRSCRSERRNVGVAGNSRSARGSRPDRLKGRNQSSAWIGSDTIRARASVRVRDSGSARRTLRPKRGAKTALTSRCT